MENNLTCLSEVKSLARTVNGIRDPVTKKLATKWISEGLPEQYSKQFNKYRK